MMTRSIQLSSASSSTPASRPLPMSRATFTGPGRAQGYQPLAARDKEITRSADLGAEMVPQRAAHLVQRLVDSPSSSRPPRLERKASA